MKKRLKTQIENADEVRRVLKKVDVSFTLHDGRDVETLLIFLPAKKGICDHEKLFQVIKNNLMANFVLSYSEIQRKLSLTPRRAPALLFQKSVRRLSAHTAKGELGELLLFTLLEVYFGAPKIMNKVSAKSSRTMPVFGADAVHAQYVSGDLRLYLGESKMRKSFSSSSSSAAESISTCLKKFDEEFDQIESYIDFPKMSPRSRDGLLDLLDPFSNSSAKISKRLHAPCFIGFVNSEVIDNDPNEYEKKYIEVAKKHIGDFYANMEAYGNDIGKTALFLIPFSCLDTLVSEFIKFMGIKK
jgi:hypothetical protein